MFHTVALPTNMYVWHFLFTGDVFDVMRLIQFCKVEKKKQFLRVNVTVSLTHILLYNLREYLSKCRTSISEFLSYLSEYYPPPPAPYFFLTYNGHDRSRL